MPFALVLPGFSRCRYPTLPCRGILSGHCILYDMIRHADKMCCDINILYNNDGFTFRRSERDASLGMALLVRQKDLGEGRPGARSRLVQVNRHHHPLHRPSSQSLVIKGSNWDIVQTTDALSG